MKKYILNTQVNKDMYILYEDDKELLRISKRANSLEKAKAFVIKLGVENLEII